MRWLRADLPASGDCVFACEKFRRSVRPAVPRAKNLDSEFPPDQTWLTGGQHAFRLGECNLVQNGPSGTHAPSADLEKLSVFEARHTRVGHAGPACRAVRGESDGT